MPSARMNRAVTVAEALVSSALHTISEERVGFGAASGTVRFPSDLSRGG